MQKKFDGLRRPTDKTPSSGVSLNKLLQRPPKKKDWYTARLHPHHHRQIVTIISVMATVAICGTLIILTNQRTLRSAFTTANKGIGALFEGLNKVVSQPQAAAALFTSSSDNFATTAADLRRLNKASKALIILPATRDGLSLLQLGYNASQAGESLAKALSDQPSLPTPTSFEQAASNASQKILVMAANHGPDIANALTKLANMQQIANGINPKALPSGISQELASWKTKLPQLNQSGQALAKLLTETPDLFGAKGERRYVILFQNNTELRPTGGFIGSYAVMTFNGGKVSNFFFQTNIYKSDLAFAQRTPIKPPYPISDATTVWGMRDANWAVDFRETAKQVLTFHQGIYGQPAHGVIAVDTSVILDLLRLTGPIEFPEYNTTLTADNFIDTVQFKVEKEYFESQQNKKINEPKTILNDFIPKLFAAIDKLPDDKKQLIPQTIFSAIERKSVQAYSNNAQAEEAFIALNIDGRVKDAPSDYLYINNANIGGGKSSKNMTQDTTLTQAVIGNHIENTLTIIRTHHGNGQWPDADNSNYMRILVPKGSELISATGTFELHEVAEEASKTVISGWFRTPIASKKNATIKYRLPETVNKKSYSLFIQRQPGENYTNYTFKSPLLKTETWELRSDSLLY